MRVRLLALAAMLSSLGCNAEARRSSDTASADAVTRDSAGEHSSGVRPGIAPQVVLGASTNPYTGNPEAIATGRQLFGGFNCAGCHSSYAGGGMGPNLRDSLWIYGGSDVQLFSTIAEGRPNGMPAWGGRIPNDQIWQIIAYLRTLGTAAEPVMPPTASGRT